MLYLVPGVGAQGGSYREIETVAKNKEGCVLINASRGLIPDNLDSNQAILGKLHKLIEY